MQLGTVLGCARLSGSPLVRALGVAFTPSSFRERNAIDGGSTQSCQTRPVILNQCNGSLQGLLSSLPDHFAGLCACEGRHGSCRLSASSQTGQSAPCANVSALVAHLRIKGTFPHSLWSFLWIHLCCSAGLQPEQKVLVAWGRVQ